MAPEAPAQPLFAAGKRGENEAGGKRDADSGQRMFANLVRDRFLVFDSLVAGVFRKRTAFGGGGLGLVLRQRARVAQQRREIRARWLRTTWVTPRNGAASV